MIAEVLVHFNNMWYIMDAGAQSFSEEIERVAGTTIHKEIWIVLFELAPHRLPSSSHCHVTMFLQFSPLFVLIASTKYDLLSTWREVAMTGSLWKLLHLSSTRVTVSPYSSSSSPSLTLRSGPLNILAVGAFVSWSQR